MQNEYPSALIYMQIGCLAIKIFKLVFTHNN